MSDNSEGKHFKRLFEDVNLRFEPSEYHNNLKFIQERVGTFQMIHRTPLFDLFFDQKKGRLCSVKDAPNVPEKHFLMRYDLAMQSFNFLEKTFKPRTQFHINLEVAMERFLEGNDQVRWLLYDLISLLYSKYIPMEQVREQYEYLTGLNMCSKVNPLMVILTIFNHRLHCHESAKKVPINILKQCKEAIPCVISADCTHSHWARTPCLEFVHDGKCSKPEECEHSHECLTCRFFQTDAKSREYIGGCYMLPFHERGFENAVLSRLKEIEQHPDDPELFEALGFTEDQLNVLRARYGRQNLGLPFRLDHFFNSLDAFYNERLPVMEPEVDVWGRVRRERLFQRSLLGPTYVFASHDLIFHNQDHRCICPRQLSIVALFNAASTVYDPMDYLEHVLFPFISRTSRFENYYFRVYRDNFPPRYLDDDESSVPPYFFFYPNHLEQFRRRLGRAKQAVMTPDQVLVEAAVELKEMIVLLHSICDVDPDARFDGVYIKKFHGESHVYKAQVHYKNTLFYSLASHGLGHIDTIVHLPVRSHLLPPSPEPKVVKPKVFKPRGVQITGPSLCGKGNNPASTPLKKKSPKKKTKKAKTSLKKK